MTSLVIGVFSSRAAAELARQRLLALGLRADQIRIEHGASLSITNVHAHRPGAANAPHRASIGIIEGLFRDLMVFDEDEIGRYADAMNRGVLVIAKPDNEAQAPAVEETLNACSDRLAPAVVAFRPSVLNTPNYDDARSLVASIRRMREAAHTEREK